MHPWGLSGPEFLWLYLAGLVVGLAVAIGLRMAARRPRPGEPPGRLAPEDLGFLAGGPRHAVQVAIARLVHSGVVRVDRRGTLTSMAEGRPTGHPLDDAVLAELTAPRKLAGKPVVTEIGESLVRRGLLVQPARAVRTRQLAPIVLYVLFAIGVARWINGIVTGLPAYPDKELSRSLTDGAAVMFAGSAWSYASAGSFDSFVHTGSSGGSTYMHNHTASSSDSSSSGGGGCGGGTP